MNIYKTFLSIFAFLHVGFSCLAQERPVKIETKELPRRLAFYAINENEKDLDVKITIKGKNFRQSRATPRFIRVPATSKVHLQTLVVMRDKQPTYTYELEVNDSLSGRALKRDYELIKIEPRKKIVLYIPKRCGSCDSLINSLDKSYYLYTSYVLAVNPEIKKQLKPAFGNHIELDSLEVPIVNMGGILHTRIENYEQLLEELHKPE
ncbi:hypothetical protein [Pareuzebyella sediminis]|uniref:hypothetical protein n=1 Tax=Pareuzebyella sediminis TaxID=2607998 RepID=UPI0011EC2D46|nr:hypothetical protein [Pareuzebyella sediminis]